MSLIIKAERFGAQAIYFKSIDFETVIGEDEDGLLSDRSPAVSWLHACAVNSGYSLISKCSKALLNGTLLKQNEPILISNFDKIKIDDYNFSFFLTDCVAEIASHNKSINMKSLSSINNCTKLKFSLLNIERIYPIIQHSQLYAGSSQTDDIYIPIQGVQKEHCLICEKDGQIYVNPVAGPISVNGLVLSDSKVIDKSDILKLEPTGIALEIL